MEKKYISNWHGNIDFLWTYGGGLSENEGGKKGNEREKLHDGKALGRNEGINERLIF
jgi:hypothetical protein